MACYPRAALVLLLLALPASGQQTRLAATTTLPAETGNNTSAPDGFRGLANGEAPAANVSKLPIRSLLYPGANTRIWVRYMPWSGDHGHMEIGYHSDGRSQGRRQVQDMMSRGITGAIVDWY